MCVSCYCLLLYCDCSRSRHSDDDSRRRHDDDDDDDYDRYDESVAGNVRYSYNVTCANTYHSVTGLPTDVIVIL